MEFLLLAALVTSGLVSVVSCLCHREVELADAKKLQDGEGVVRGEDRKCLRNQAPGTADVMTKVLKQLTASWKPCQS